MFTDTRILASLASIPERSGALKRVVASLAPQVDEIRISLNEYEQVPKFLGRYDHVRATLRPAPNRGDGEKFADVDDWDGYVLVCDDDLVYPPDYAARMIEGIEKHGPNVLASHHGGTTLGWNGSAVAASHKRVRCLDDTPEDDTDVNVVGTGVMGYHAAHVPVYSDVFEHANMADVQMACHARLLGIRMVCLSHPHRWLRDICPMDGRRIYASNRNRDGTLCDTHEERERQIQRFDWRAPAPARPFIHVSVATCGRPEKLLELLGDLEREGRWVDLNVAVFEDPTGADYSEARALCVRKRWTWQAFPKRLGRQRFWELVHAELRATRRATGEWFVFLPDDVRLVRHAFPRAIQTWSLLDDPSTLTLWRLQSLEGLANWTGRQPLQHAHATETFHVDGLFMCKREALEALRFRCPPSRNLNGTGSGVGASISRKLFDGGKRMYRVDSSLALDNSDGVSIMNPDERKKNPTVTL